MELSSFKRNAAAAAEGRWIDGIPHAPGLRLRVRGLSSPKAVACRRKKERGVEKKDRERGGGFKPETERRITREVLHEAILLEWDGLKDRGEPIPYTEEVAAKLLLDPDFDEFAGAVTWAASIVDVDTEEVAEEQKGNSSKSSSGS